MKKVFTILFCFCMLCTKAQTTVKADLAPTQDSTKNLNLSKKGYDSWKAHSDLGTASKKAVNPLYEAPPMSGSNPLFQGIVAGTPIGGIIVKGGKNPGGQMMTLSTDEKGEVTLPILEAGNYRFTIVAPSASATPTANKDKRVYTGGRKNEDVAVAAERKGWDGTVKGSSYLAGGPIGGIVVKGGRNLGGKMFTLITNPNGEIELNGLEPGVYKFVLTAPLK